MNRNLYYLEVTAKSDPTPAGIKNTTINPPTRNESVASVIKKLQDVNNNNQPKAVNGGAKGRYCFHYSVESLSKLFLKLVIQSFACFSRTFVSVLKLPI